jgi:hypothetical protein
VGAQWKLIDLDAACAIGDEPVGHKSSSAYVPPEAVDVDPVTGSARVRSVVAVASGKAHYELLTAHPSFDVWSLGCILYQMVTPDVRQLFQGGRDDSLPDDPTEEDNLRALADWSDDLKQKKLSRVADGKARNLLSQMLHKDPRHRASLARVLAHPFLSGQRVARMVGEKPRFDVFLSYRVAADAPHVETLYHALTAQGLTVYWDKLCLEPGVDWEQGFCEGLVSAKAFVPLLSRGAINHPDKPWQNFTQLAADSKCDNVFLEHRLAVELQGLGLIEKIFPVFIGDKDGTSGQYSNYFGAGCHPRLPDIAVAAVEDKLRHHMETQVRARRVESIRPSPPPWTCALPTPSPPSILRQALGTPLVPDRTVASVVGAITACQGAFIEGDAGSAFQRAADSVVKMLATAPVPAGSRPPSAAGGRGGAAGPVHVTSGAGGSDGDVVHALRAQLDAVQGTLAVVNAALSDDFDTADEAHVMVARVREMLEKRKTEEGWKGD